MDLAVIKKWAERKDFYILILVFAVLPIFSHGGGLGIAAILSVSGLGALFGFRFLPLSITARRVPLPIYLLALLLVWGFITSFYSPYRSDNTLGNAVKILFGVPLYLMCASVIKSCSADEKKKQTLIKILVFTAIGSAIAILLDQISGYAITLALDPLAAGQDMNAKRGDIMQNISQGTAVLTVLLAPVCVLLWGRGQYGKPMAFVLAALVLACAISMGKSASVAAILLAAGMMGFAKWRPVAAIKLSFLFTGLAIFFAPLLAWASSNLDANTKARLPFSWEERVENWGFLFQKILEHPFIGHGFDAARTFNDTHIIRGFEGRAIVSLHPHNAGLQLWVELGLIGAMLACAVLYRRAILFTAHARRDEPPFQGSNDRGKRLDLYLYSAVKFVLRALARLVVGRNYFRGGASLFDQRLNLIGQK